MHLPGQWQHSQLRRVTWNVRSRKSLISSHFINFLCSVSRWIRVRVKAWASPFRPASGFETCTFLALFKPESLLAEHSVLLKQSVGFHGKPKDRWSVLLGVGGLGRHLIAFTLPKSISFGSVLGNPQTEGHSVSHVARGSILQEWTQECKQKQTETIPSLSCIHPVQITSWSFTRISITLSATGWANASHYLDSTQTINPKGKEIMSQNESDTYGLLWSFTGSFPSQKDALESSKSSLKFSASSTQQQNYQPDVA